MLSHRNLDDLTIRIIRVNGDDHASPFEGVVFTSRHDEPLMVVGGTFNGVIKTIASELTGGVDANFGVSRVW